MSTGKDNLLNAWRTPYGSSIFQAGVMCILSAEAVLMGGTETMSELPHDRLMDGLLVKRPLSVFSPRSPRRSSAVTSHPTTSSSSPAPGTRRPPSMKSSTDAIGSTWEASKQRAEPRLPPTPLTVRSAGGAVKRETLDFYVVLFTAVRNERRRDRQSHISGKNF